MQPATVGMQEISSQFSFVTTLPDFSGAVADVPWLAGPLHWLSLSRLVFRAFGGQTEKVPAHRRISGRWDDRTPVDAVEPEDCAPSSPPSPARRAGRMTSTTS